MQSRFPQQNLSSVGMSLQVKIINIIFSTNFTFMAKVKQETRSITTTNLMITMWNNNVNSHTTSEQQYIQSKYKNKN
jgi:chemotaxis protein CheY-P-specific phosphatase CheC